MSRRLLALCVFALAAVAPSLAFAQTDQRLMFGEFDEGAWGKTNDRLLFEGDSTVRSPSGTDTGDAQVFFWDSTGRFKLSVDNPTAPRIGYRWATMDFDTTSKAIPRHLDELSMAAGFQLGEMAGGKVSGVIGAGYSSNNPFADAQGIFGIGHLFWQKQLNEKDALIISIDYNGVNAFLPDIPLPGFAYIHREENFQILFGYPRSELTWQIIPNLTLDAAYEVPYTADVTLDYAITKHWHVYSGFSNFFNGFRQDDQDLTDRVFYQMARAEAGIRYVQPDFVLKGAYFDMGLAAGYAFEQNFYDGFDVRDLTSRAELSDAPYIGLTIRGRF